MKKMSTYLLTMFMILFWVFRIVLAITDSMGISLGFSIPNIALEIPLLFVTVFLVVLVFKRKLIGVIGYFVVQAIYYGPALFSNVMSVFSNENAAITTYSDLFINAIAIILPICILIDWLMDRNRQNHYKDKKTDWFYQNEEYDREIDERADKNNYKTL